MRATRPRAHPQRRTRTMSTHFVLAAVVAALCCGNAFTAAAQDTASTAPAKWLISLSVGVPGSSGRPAPELTTVGVQWTRLRPGHLGADFALGTAPRALASGAVALGARAGVALPLALSSKTLLIPSVGLSAVGGFAGEGVGGLVGPNAGVAVVATGMGAYGLRAGITTHFLVNWERPIWLLEMGIVSRH